jgi:outer membrane protein W
MRDDSIPSQDRFLRHVGAMKQLLVCVVAIGLTEPALAQRSVAIFVDAEGVHRSSAVQFEPNRVQYVPRFDNGGGVGGGINFFLSDRVSLEMKVAALASRLHLRRSGSDFVAVADLGYAQIYPITALLQWHMLEHGTFRPYIGAGAGHVILRNIKKRAIGTTGVAFEDPTGFVIDGGVEWSLSKRWSIIGDARYTPIETRSTAQFTGTASRAEIDVKPLVISTGIAFRF